MWGGIDAVEAVVGLIAGGLICRREVPGTVLVRSTGGLSDCPQSGSSECGGSVATDAVVVRV